MGWGFICDAGLGSMLGIWAGGSFHRGLVVRRAALESLLHGNESFATHFTHDEPELLKQLSTGQHPKIFWLGCSDSSVPESLICNARSGDMFIHRNIANSFKVGDASSIAVLAYAVNNLGIKHVVVCGSSSPLSPSPPKIGVLATYSLPGYHERPLRLWRSSSGDGFSAVAHALTTTARKRSPSGSLH